MAAGENVGFEPAFEGVLAEHLHDAAEKVELAAVGVFRFVLGEPCFFGCGVDAVRLIGGGLVRAEDAEVGHIAPHDVAQENGRECRSAET